MAKVDTVFIALSRPDGGVSVMNFVTKQYDSADGPGWEREPNEENILIDCAKSNTEIVSWKIVDVSDIPNDRTFRNAWTHDGDKFDVDMPKAREIHKDKLRQEREPKLAALDVQFMRALESGDTTAQADITAQKQSLRDITRLPAIEAAKTPEDLKAITLGE